MPLAAIGEAKLVLTDELIKRIAPPAEAARRATDETDEAGAERAETH